MSKKTSVLIVDDHAVVREGLRTLINMQEDLEVTGEAANGQEAVRVALQTRPDVIIMDVMMPEMDGVQAITAILEAWPEAQIMILTSFNSDDKTFAAMRAGAVGCLLKDSTPKDLIQSVRDTALGLSHLHPQAARQLVEEIKSPRPSTRDRLNTLTEREKEVLVMVAQGMTNTAISRRLFISEGTVRSHVSNTLTKLNLENRTQMVLFAIENHLIAHPVE
ncbi:MAG TPA: response regulator transcription factor [Anaerolineaceae bacterium]|nr:response regulator transcription factor [Anaerolineaceae bacterium]HPN51604.1 response regulator transcription factor [Anaerolineaceae bacterium]